MEYYESKNGKLYNSYDIINALDIVFGIDRQSLLPNIEDTVIGTILLTNVCNGIIRKIDSNDISYEFLIKHGEYIKAVQLYKNEHPKLTILECKNAIDKIKEEIDGFERAYIPVTKNPPPRC